MYTTRTVSTCGASATRNAALDALKLATGVKPLASGALRPTSVVHYQNHSLRGAPVGSRQFSSTPSARIKEFFPAHDSPSIRKTEAAWPHPIYTEEQMNAVEISHRETRNLSDRVAFFAVRVLRTGLDLVSGYRHDKAVRLAKTDPEAAKKYEMTEKKYLIRNIFLESVAGVPGMVAGMLRHLASMRRLKRDLGWLETLLEESYNERMHLLIWLKLGEPGLFMRAAVLGAQGVFFNGFFLAYLFSPRTCHRFVGYLEEEATLTYTREIEDLDAGKLPNWAKMPAPDIAVDYYKMPEGKRTIRDLLLWIRADESKHREVNHTFGNLDQKNDPNPYVSEYKDPSKPHPVKGIEHQRPKGWERSDVI